MAEEKRFEKKVRAYLDSIGAWHLKTISNGFPAYTWLAESLKNSPAWEKNGVWRRWNS